MPAARKNSSSARNIPDVALTHPERVLFKSPLITKKALAEFYGDLAEFILPGLINRPLMVLRCPDGSDGQCFFQKHLSHAPDAIHEVDDPQNKQRWSYVKDLNGLIGLVQMNALEYHVWGCTVRNLERVDQLVMDLDPAPDVPWKRVIEAALELRRILDTLKLRCFVRTTGSKGLHVVAPVRPGASWTAGRAFARGLAEHLARERPQQYLAVAGKAERQGKIFVDYLRNGRGSTAVCSYSLRNRPRAPVATPLSWEELPRVRAADQFSFDNIRRRLARLPADPWTEFATVRQSLPAPPQ